MSHSKTQVVDGAKMCSGCEVTQPLKNFTPQKNGLGGRAAQCRPCRNARQRGVYLTPDRRRKHALRRYGVTPEEFDRLWEEQGGVCQICQTEPAAIPNQDHDHLTGTNRSLLCHRCNLGLGQFLDDPDLLERAASYLRSWQEFTIGLAA